MTTVCDKVLTQSLRLLTNKKDRSAKVISDLGVNRIVRIFHTPKAGVKNPFVTGTEYVNATMTGAMQSAAGNIVDLGFVTHYNKNLAIDITNGSACVRIEGNGHFFQASLGLFGVHTGKDLYIAQNIDGVNGIAFAPNISINPYHLLPSGTGFAAPARPDTAIHSIRVENWANQQSVVAVGTAYLDTQDEDFVFEDAETANSMGDTSWYRCANSVMWGDIEIAPHQFLSHPACTEDGLAPLEVVDFAFAFHGSWANYPEVTSYNKKNMITCLPPFKFVGLDLNGNVVKVWERPDGKPYNDPSLNSGNTLDGRGGRTTTAAIHPKVNIHMGAIYESKQPALNPMKMYEGLATNAFRPSMAHLNYSCTSVEPLYTGGYGQYSLNGLAHMYYLPPYPLPLGAFNPTTPDTYLNYGDMNTDGHSSYAAGWAEGYMYVGGQPGGHNWYTSPGGPRFDRCVMPSVFAMYFTFPNGSRLQENTPWKLMANEFVKNYSNHSNHFFSNPKKLFLDTNANLLRSKWQLIGQYYGDQAYREAGILINADQRDGTNDSHYDSLGNMVDSGWGRDPLHGYSHCGLAALLWRRPYHAILSKKDTHYNFMLSGDPSTKSVMVDYFMVRTMAWDWLAYPIAWKLASPHELGFTKNEIETRFGLLLENIYLNIYVPLMITNSQDPFIVSIRNLGTPLKVADDYSSAITQGGQLGFYMGHVLVLMKQTGFWNAMYSKGGHIKLVLDMIIACYDKFAFDHILDTNGITATGYDSFPNYILGNGTKANSCPSSWTQFQALWKANDGSNLTHNSDGTIFPGERDVSDGLAQQYILMRPLFFPEFTNSRMSAAVAKVRAYQNDTKTNVATYPVGYSQSTVDYGARVPGVLELKAPTIVGPGT